MAKTTNKSPFIQLYESTLNEIQMSDQMGKGFNDFYEKYSKRPYAGDTSLFINFSNFSDNTIDKNPAKVQGHGDPQSVYAYPWGGPKGYAKTNPADIRYGKSATYLRVIRARDVPVLNLQNMNSSDMEQMFRDAHGEWFSDWLPLLKKYYTHTKYTPALWFVSIQLEKGELQKIAEYFKEKKRNPFTTDKPELKTKTGQAQTDFFVKEGYKIIIDTAKSQAKAIINQAEPEQILFLTRDSFDVIETFLIRGEKQNDKAKNRSITSLDSKHEEALKRKIAAGICKGISDKLMSSAAITANLNGYALFFTNKGRQIGIRFNVPDSYYDNKKFGEKPHREFTKSNNLSADIYIISEKKTIKYQSYSDDTFAEIITTISKQWHAEPEMNPEFVPIRSEVEYKEYTKRQETKAHNSNMIVSINALNNDPSGNDVLQQKEVAKYYGVFYPENPSKAETFLYEYSTYIGLKWGRVYNEESDKGEQERLLTLDKIPSYIIEAGDVSKESITGALDLRRKILVQLWEEKYDGRSGHSNWKGDARDYYATSVLLKYLKEKSK